MYRQIQVDPSDRHYQKILWRNDPTKLLLTYQLNRVTFRRASAPFLANRTLHQLAADEAEGYSRVSATFKSEFYMDNFITCADQNVTPQT
ncbi:hypothetical protein WN51_07409 [Melipona quadrifasciata]|uniref:Uncharacterized protein n=1 Tax=Melipona quadrifasciata TaxID=166423 RepID=A0A0M8ZQ84_9HYME|nr:hypothetical protein WN51_07409 [Melipona quadrifasciata]